MKSSDNPALTDNLVGDADPNSATHPGILTKLYVRYRAVLTNYLESMVGSLPDAEDLVQETFIRIHRSEVDESRSPRSLLYITARHLAFNARKGKMKLATDVVDDFDLLGLHDESPDAEAQAISRQEFRLLCNAVNNLPPKCKKVFILRKVYGYSQAEVAAKMEIAESTVEKHLGRGVLRVFNQLGGKLSYVSAAGDD